MNLKKHKEINELLQQLLLQVQPILADKFIGMYIGGSLTNESFNYETSDIDCYFITTSELPLNIAKNIEKIHKKFYSSKLKYAKKVEASYIHQKDILHFNPSGMRPYFNEGSYYLGEYGNNYIIELHVLREKGISILGPDIKSLIPKISTQDLMLAIHKNLHEYWEVTLNDFSKFSRSDYQIFAIFTMCRTLYSLEKGIITSKMEAAQWALQRLDNNWKNLIELAITWRPDQDLNKLAETVEFVKYVIRKTYCYQRGGNEI
jgi:hypothetical protein